MTTIQFADLVLEGMARAELRLSSQPGWEIEPDDPDRPSEICMTISGPLDEGHTFETVLDLKVPQARTIAAAIIALADYLDALARKRSP